MPLWDDAPNVSGPQVPLVWRVPEGPGIPVGQRSNTRNHAGPGCGAGGRWQGLAGLRDDAPSEARGADGERAGRPRGDRNSHSWLDPKVPQARMSSTHSLVTRNKMRKRASERESEFLEACLRTGNRVP